MLRPPNTQPLINTLTAHEPVGFIVTAVPDYIDASV